MDALIDRSELTTLEHPVVRRPLEFDAFYRASYHRALGLAIVLCGDRSVAEEVTQDAFLAAMRQWDEVGMFEDPMAWIRRVVSNKSVSWFRRAQLEARSLFRIGAPERVAGPAPDGIDIWREVQRLPIRQRQVIALTYVEDLARAEVAVVLGIGEETVKTHLERARSTLNSRLRQGHGGQR